MKCSYLILLCQCIFMKFFMLSEEINDEVWPLSDVKIALMISPNRSQNLHFKLTNRVLANEHLPVWVLKEEIEPTGSSTHPKLELAHGVMEQLGNFTFYQDPVMNSAAVYFHQRRQLDGMIDTRYLIQELSIDKINSTSVTTIQLGTSGIIDRPQLIEMWPLIPITNEDFIDTVEYEIRKTYQNRLYDGYPEILVIVSCELAQELLKNAKDSNKHTPIISHVLNLFNGVDMLYSKLTKTNIKLNIAGIIIDNECKALYYLEDCYGELVNKVEQYRSIILNDECIIDEIRALVSEQKNVIPIDFYDVVVFLSGTHLFGMRNGKVPRLEGRTSYKPVYNTKKLDILSVSIAAIRENSSSTNYATVAHALAHSMNVHHDKRPFEKEEEEHCGNMMKSNGKYGYEGCMSWSDTSEMKFQTFFSSTDCCGFINYPRSLYAERRIETLTADEQCQCYGYKSKINPEKFSDEYCYSPLQCQNDNSQVYETLIPLNGTWCGIKKMCWQWACGNH